MVNKNYVRYKDHYRKKSPSRGDHLKQYQWKPGESGNKDGRPTGQISLVEELKKYLRRHPEDAQAVIEALIKQGKIGNIVATKEMLDRIDGKVAERHKLEADIPIQLNFMPAQILLDQHSDQPEDELE